MIKTWTLLIAFFSATLLTAQQEQFFFQKLDCNVASTLCFDPDSNIWIGATRNQQPLLFKLDRNGLPLDQAPLNIPYGNSNILTALLIDSEGMLLGCGTMTPTVPSQPESSFAFRYDPASRTMLWHRRLSHSFLFAYGILEAKPGGHFTVYGYNSDLSSAADILMLDRNTGAALPGFNNSYEFGHDDAARSAVYHQGDLYVAGRNDLGALAVGQYARQGLWRIDSSGAPVWALLGSVPDFQLAALQGNDLLIEEDTIISLSSGNEQSQNLNQAGHIFLQKTTLAGDLVWIRKYDVTDFGYSTETGFDLISVPDGFLIFGGTLDGSERDFLLKTDKNGKLLWAKGLKSAASNLGTLIKPQARLLTDGRALFMISRIQEGNKSYEVLIKTDMNANIAGCNRLFALVALEIPLFNPFSSKKTLVRSTSTAISVETVVDLVSAPPAVFEKFCENEEIVPQNPCTPSTFLRQLGATGTFAGNSINSLAASPKGGIYAAGQIDGKSMLAAFDAAGALQWSRQLPLVNGEAVQITAIMFDSDSMLAGCGYFGDPLVQRNRYIFRYNPDADSLLWATSFASLQPEDGGILEMKPGGNFLVYHNLRLADERSVPETVQVNRNTGSLIALSGRRYDFDFGDQQYSSMVAGGPSLFAVGQYGFGRPYMALTRINADFGGLNWAQTSHTDTASQAISGGYGSICMDGNNIVSAYAGKDSANSAQQTTLFLQKTTPFGVIVWTREFKVPAFHEIELIAIPDGFVLMAKTALAGYAFFKTDQNGNLLLAKTFELGGGPGLSTDFEKTQGRLVLHDQHLFFALHDHRLGHLAAYLLKTDLNLNVAEPCAALQPFSPGLGYVVDPVATKFTEGVFVTPLTGQALSLDTLSGATFEVMQQCPPVYEAPDLDLGPDQTICSADTALLSSNADFVEYLWQDGSTDPTLTATTAGTYILEVTSLCGAVQRDTLVLSMEPNPSRQISLAVAPNVPVLIGGANYFSPDTVTLLLPSGTGLCDTLESYLLGPCQPISTARTLTFYPSQTLTIDGILYDQPGIYSHTLISHFGCDSIVTYALEWIITSLQVNCPSDRIDSTGLYQNTAQVFYDPPTATTSCPEPGLNLNLLSGLPSGSAFPLGKTQVCYEIANACGIRDSCCFTVEVVPTAPPCDVKTLPGGCLQVELLGVQLDSIGQRRYSIRLLNKCATPLDYLAVQLPKGVLAVEPANGSTYTAPSGRAYLVRNPNASPFHSIRFRAAADGLKNGAADVFGYSLPQQSDPPYLHVYAKLADGTSVETHLSTLSCAPLPWNSQDRDAETLPLASGSGLRLWPNPTSGDLFVDLQPWLGQEVYLEIANTQAQVVFSKTALVNAPVLLLPEVERLPAGVYYLMVQGLDGVVALGRVLVTTE